MKTIISANDIKKEILSKQSKSKTFFIFCSVLAVLWAILDIVMIIYPQAVFSSSGGQLQRVIAVIASTVSVILLSIVSFRYFRNCHKIKNDKFVIITEKLYHKSVEDIIYYKRVRIENVFYFKSGRIFVESSMYKDANIGDEFYLVMLDDKAPFYVYDKKHYKIDL